MNSIMNLKPSRATRNHAEIKKVVKQLRSQRINGMISQSDIARYLEVAQPTVSYLERLTVQPNLLLIMEYANALGLQLRFSLEEL